MKYIYISSPYTCGDPETNVQISIDAAEQLIERGYVPFVPLLCHYWEKERPHPYEYWTKLVFPWVKRCDAVLRLPGHSHGADAEVKIALEQGIPVFFSFDDFPPINSCFGALDGKDTVCSREANT